ncbi:Aurora kinase C [Tritrichomonas foetus]|uniref:Aurora kinase C n=1 Tax=Tritrichomonas foetus TaxID=1144522 RepID=A0A1J4JAX7_9EUKA|nr:Aurora kinase C [Tritrichomonas foetus]|eukprot:OHS94412.1 Aurora kinase C [Tritrichomonas foetus]
MRANSKISPSSLPITIGDYIFKKYLCKGGSSEIYIIESNKFKQLYVGKVITVNQRNMEQQWKSFNSEITALSHLNNPNIIRMYDHFRMSNQFFVILEYCPLGSLSDKIEVNIGLSLTQFVEVASQIISALSFCHAKNIAHRDIKASNILFDLYGRAKLSDFGLSLHAPNKMLQNSFCGSLVYTAPEVIMRKPNNPFYTDIWSLGVLFCVMLTGKSPWTAKDQDTMLQQIMRAEYVVPDSAPPELVALIAKMLVPNPDDRIKISELMKNELLFPQNTKENKIKEKEKIIIHNAKSLYSKHLSIKPSKVNSHHISLASSSFLTHSGTNLSYSFRSKSSMDNIQMTFVEE